ncbi:MAG: response regulator transcription factor [Bryobacterales bacterium]|nr:response regulator transcription factor [Bryobacterales bacterium]
MIRLLIVEDETLFRLGLHRLLSLNPDFSVIGEAADGEQALAQAAALAPDLIIMDVNLPRLSGIAALEQLRAAGSSIPVILLSNFDEEDAFLRKDVPFEDLTSTIHAALRGRTYLPLHHYR